ncbi:hypothetical protein [Nostoc sp. 106C]|uniref:hypothetical protein n=1 Tax=Nostoc sp. 106C TaxID=1932667 RepID=UPI000B6E673D|nr:hypothetical protein [Nostoc sp. 106C]OUL31900.1 hypothetical protein BV378_01135 [Nostoc sp. RF31YmG]OUL36260.1 hypothetical protein BV375_00190 [Nostoc sp. 106C]
MRKHQVIFIPLALSLVGILGFSYFNKRSQITACKPSEFIAAKGKQYLYPKKIVIQPWRGQHHVYGVFSVSKEFQTDNLMQVTLPDHSTECGIVDPIDNSYSNGAYAQPGHYLVKGYLNTRIALLLIVQGKGNELEQANNWTLGYIKKK